MKIIARIRNDFKEKFGIPRQSGIAEKLVSRIVFEPEYRVREALRGIEEYSHLWLLWEFSEAKRESWSPTVRPPRLGGNKRVGVFATRSPYRPSPIGLSSVKLLGIEESDSLGQVLVVGGADLLDGTPIYDIKPYLSFTDSHPDAVCGFADRVFGLGLRVDFPEELLRLVDLESRETLITVLEGDPRPHYKTDPDYEYGMRHGNYEIKFKVASDVLYVTGVEVLEKTE